VAELPLTEAEVLAFLRAVENGEVSLECAAEPAKISGVIRYRASNGWNVELHADGGEWGRLERIGAATREVSWEDIEADMPDVATYMPSSDVAWRCYGLPGYMERAKERWSGAPRPRSERPVDPYELVQAVLRGDARPELDDASAEALATVLTDETNSFVRKNEFVSFVGERSHSERTLHAMTAAPAVLGEILRRAEVDGPIEDSVVLGIPGFSLGARTVANRMVWLVPLRNGIEIIVRPGPGTLSAPFTRSLPSNMPISK
jgi:hypothetical protein